jgi:hypothetical protein
VPVPRPRSAEQHRDQRDSARDQLIADGRAAVFDTIADAALKLCDAAP